MFQIPDDTRQFVQRFVADYRQDRSQRLFLTHHEAASEENTWTGVPKTLSINMKLL